MERIITKIEQFIPAQPKAERVAAYARVSTGKDAMRHSLAAQISYYSDMIQKHHGWLYCGVYADEALTGTKDNRDNFQRMLRDCRAGKLDRIITKSISRFARNTVTLLETVRELKLLGVDVFFEEQNIHTLSADGELMLTILASYAQAESLSASENLKWRIRKGFEKGEIFCLSMMYGYDREDKQLVINKKEAKVVKEIFKRVLDGESMNSIAKDLNSRKIKTKQGYDWTAYRIACMLRNEKYTGNSLLQKTYINNHLQKEKLKNVGILPQYYAEGTHESIISIEIFEAVQEIMAQKAKTCEHYAYHTNTMFTSYIRCGKCGHNYRRGKQNGRYFWNCSVFLSQGKSHCQEPRIPEDTLYRLTAEVLGITDFTEDDLFEAITDIVAFNHTLTFNLQTGEKIVKEWQPRSRAKSWTPEMKETARQRVLKQRSEK